MTHTHRNGRRHGKSLIELVVVIATLATVMTLGARTMILLMRADGAGLQSVNAAVSLASLSREFRQDVHAARNVTLTQPDPHAPPALLLTFSDDRSIRYVSDSDRILRTVNRGAEVAHRDAFRLPNGRSTFTLSQQPPIVTLIHVRNAERKTPTPTGSAPRYEFRIEAVSARDHRFSNSSE